MIEPLSRPTPAGSPSHGRAPFPHAATLAPPNPKGRPLSGCSRPIRRRIDTEGSRYIGRPDRNLSRRETPSDFEQLLRAEPRLHGYVGGSSAERFPIEEIRG